MIEKNPHELTSVVGKDMSLLIDSDINAAYNNGYIFSSKDDFDSCRVRQASYELTLLEARGLRKEELREVYNKDKLQAQDCSAYTCISDDNRDKSIIINPWRCCLLIAKENLNIPDNVVGHVFARGQLFQSGIIVESTYIDPGFTTLIHLMAFNATQREVKIPIGVAIARLELIHLSTVVDKPHGGGGVERTPEMSSLVWPWPVSNKKYNEEIAEAVKLRDNDARLLAMDRMTNVVIALEERSRYQVRLNSWFKIYVSLTIPLFFLLLLNFMDVRNILNPDMQLKYDKLVYDIGLWGPILYFSFIYLPLIYILRKSFFIAFGVEYNDNDK